jgi:hypothetical protein
MHQLLRKDVAPKANLLAPDTTGMNFYRADPVLADLLRIYLPKALFRHIEPHLDRLGERKTRRKTRLPGCCSVIARPAWLRLAN